MECREKTLKIFKKNAYFQVNPDLKQSKSYIFSYSGKFRRTPFREQSPPEGIFKKLLLDQLKRPTIILSIGLLLFYPGLLFGGSNFLSIDSTFSNMDIVECGTYYTRPQSPISFQEVSKFHDDQFSELSETDGSFFARGDIWVKLKLKNQTTLPKEIIIQIREVRVNELQFFTVKQGVIDSSAVMGDYHKFDRRPVYHPLFLYPIELASQEQAEVFILYRKIGETITLNTELWEKKAFDIQDRNEHFTFSLFLGFLVCITGMAALIAVVSRRPLLLSFAAYCASCLLMVLLITGYGFMYLWPNYPYWNGVGYLFVAFYYLSMLQMTKLYLETAKFAPTAHRFFNIAQFLILFVFAPCVLMHWYLPAGMKVLIGRSGLVLLLLTTIAIIATSVYIIRQKRTWGSVFFLLGFSFSILAVALFVVEQLGSQDTIWGMETTLLFILLDFMVLLTVFSNQIRQAFIRNLHLQEALAHSRLTAANALLEGQLEERKRLSQELHDGISIQLALLKMKLSTLFERKSEEEKRILQSVGKISQDIRAFTHAIAPLNLERQSLAEAIEDLVYEVERQTVVSIFLNFNEFREEQLLDNQKYAVFQSLQELFNNTIKHTDATEIRVSIELKDQFMLSYADNGNGFDLSRSFNGIGLKNIRSRAQLLNGHFRIYSSEKGSRFEFSF